MKPLDLLHEPAMYIIGTVVSLATLTWGGITSILGQAPIPDPTTAGAWSFYGVLIVAIIVLFLCMCAMARWFANFWLKKQEDMQKEMTDSHSLVSKSNQDVAGALRKLTDVVERQNEWFDQVYRDDIKHRLSSPKPHIP
jgi:hypothetical protein